MEERKKTMDGNQAAAEAAYFYSEVAAIYPITPSTTMAELADEWAAGGKKNIFGEVLRVTEFQSEAGAAGGMHGALLAGALATTFTASQGLLLMLPNLYRMAGERLPGVFHVAARAIATHALSIFGDHSDVYACRQTGAVLLCASNVQEVMDFAPVAHRIAVEGRLPVIHFFDGFRTSHEIQKISVWEEKDYRAFLNQKAVERFREERLTPTHGREVGSSQDTSVFFQCREASNLDYKKFPTLVEQCFFDISTRTGRCYRLFEYYGAEDAEHVVVAMGSVCGTIEETIDSRKGEKLGIIKVRLYRPFSVRHFLEAMPKSVRYVSVLDRTKEPGATGEPLYLDVVAALKEVGREDIQVLHGRYGLGSKDTTPEDIAAVFDNHQINPFTVGILDDVTRMSLFPVAIQKKQSFSCKFWGFGGDGTVGANKSTVKIVGDHTPLYVQAYFSYDSKKSRGLTISHLRFDEQPIRSAYQISQADFVACHNPTYLYKYDMVQEIRDGGIFLFNCPYENEPVEKWLPERVRKYLLEHRICFFAINALEIGKEIGLNSRVNTILQAAFFRLSGLLPLEEAEKWMQEAARQAYLKKGEEIVRMNNEAIRRGMREIWQVELTEGQYAFAANRRDNPKPEGPHRRELEAFINVVQRPMEAQRGNEIPVSVFRELKLAAGSVPSGSAAYERRDVSTEIPCWRPENCIQCNLCSYVCPHAVIRPIVLDEKQLQNMPKGMQVIPMAGMEKLWLAVIISKVDCTGCGSCAAVCPGKKGNKALTMLRVEEKVGEEVAEHRSQATGDSFFLRQQRCFDWGKGLSVPKEVLEKFPVTTVKGSQFRMPYLEFHGACAGCGETPYARLLTQLFGERMYIANATGCSSIWGNSFPSTPYTVNEKGEGPAWANSLFEDGAEFGYGMYLAGKGKQGNGKKNNSYWVFGGDGWAYDIGFSGVDHVLASGENINLFVFDTEVYSNTGGQASKATPYGSSAKFAADGKRTPKKDLAAIAMTYKNVYVAQIAMGADYQQTLRAICEAESYPGPSLLIAYAPCISHGIKAGMGSAQHEEKKAVETGYWHLFRYDPRRREQRKNVFQLDSKAPTLSYQDFLEGEIRYTSLQQRDEKMARKLFEEAQKHAAEKYGELVRKVSSLV